MCATTGTSGGTVTQTTLLEWDMKSVCESKKEATNLYLGDYTTFLDTECDEISLQDGECINDFTTFYTLGFVIGFGYNTTLNNSGIVSYWKGSGYTTWAAMEASVSISSVRSPMGNARIGAGNSTETQTCLTSFGIAELEYGEYSGYEGGIVNVELYYNEEIPHYNSSECDTRRTPVEVNLDALTEAVAGVLITFVIIGICCCGCVALAIWFFFCRRTGSKGSLNENNQRPRTPEKAPETTTTTIVQQPAMMAPVMMQQPAPMMV